MSGFAKRPRFEKQKASRRPTGGPWTLAQASLGHRSETCLGEWAEPSSAARKVTYPTDLFYGPGYPSRPVEMRTRKNHLTGLTRIKIVTGSRSARDPPRLSPPHPPGR